MANLRFDQREGGAFLNHVVVPGDAASSKILRRVGASDPARRMPPPNTTTPLDAKQVALIKQWVETGAKWDAHWAYIAPKRPEAPEVSNPSWVRNPIDRFVLARLDREGMKPSPEAVRPILLRRLSLDLTGLPPTPAELDAFLADRSPDAYEKQVDRLLASPRYGERMAMHWLDLARYADTHGYHIDSHRDMWHWRDWVIAAFNRNEPYDRFTIDQLAGDLLPKPTQEQLIATGFNRNHMINFEGGAIPEEYQTEYVIDRLEATSNVWMGTTMGCARCHDHKYDPISQREFYQFYAFFNSIPEKGLDGRKGNAEPLLQLPSAPQAAHLKEVTTELAAKKAALPEGEIASLQTDWEAKADLPEAPRQGLVAHYEFDGGLSDSSGLYHAGRVITGDLQFPAGALNRAADFDGGTQVSFGNITLERDRPFAISAWTRGGGEFLQKVEGDPGRRGYELWFDEAIPIGHLQRGAKLLIRLSHRLPDDAIEIATRRRLPTSSKDPAASRPWYLVAINYDGSGLASGLHVFVNGEPEPVDVLHDHLTGSIANSQPLAIGTKALGTPYKGQLDDLRIYNRPLTIDEIGNLTREQPASATLAIPSGKRSKEQNAALREYFLTAAAAPSMRADYARLKQLTSEKQELEDVIPTTMVMKEMEKPRETAVLGRGDYQNRGAKVTAAVPSMLPPLPKDAPANRLTLARWLVDPSHPLTSRVAVNRFWQMYFGVGIVKTAEDFGSQGEAPSHPELLDWLATEFMRTGWDVKGMQRLIVLSATYRQSSRTTPELVEKDPENRLLARGPRFRLPAEMVRDNALYLSGLLRERVGGPSVFPYQPSGLWEETAFGDVYSAQSYTPSHGDDLYRRSMYTFWKRTSGPPSLITFDAPDREKCTARRLTTNTPLQALVLMNDPTYIEAARWLAQRALTEAGTDTGRRIRYAFRLATSRAPAPREMQLLRDLEEVETAHFRRDPDAARKLVTVGESKPSTSFDTGQLAAWTTVASAILNLDETITKE